jgi:hypothetical protein
MYCVNNLLLSISLFGITNLDIERPETYSQSNPPIIYEINHQIDFPYHIYLELEATAQNKITEVVFYYTFNGQQTIIYGKPSFEPSKNVQTRHKINTSKANYLPPGLIITWHCLITDSQGNTIETKKQTFPYLNPELNWEKLESENFNLYWHDGNKNMISKVASQTNILLNKSKKIFDLTVHPKINVVVINNDRKSMPPISHKAASTHLYAGFAFPEYQTAVINTARIELLTHELIHIYLDQKVGIYKPFVPAWLNEGLANYLATGQSTLKPIDESEDWFKLQNMHNVPGRPQDVHKFYYQSEKVVAYLIESYGYKKMNMLLEELSGGQKIDEAMLKSYGFSVSQANSLWKTNTIYVHQNPIGIKYLTLSAIFASIFYLWNLHILQKETQVECDFFKKHRLI